MFTGRDLLRSFSREKFEPALFVADVASIEHMEDNVDNVHQQVLEGGALWWRSIIKFMFIGGGGEIAFTTASVLTK